MTVPHFKLPLNLPHAATIAARIEYHLAKWRPADPAVPAVVELIGLLAPYHAAGENPAAEEAKGAVGEAARLGRIVVEHIERIGLRDDRLGQAVRNLFECLELGEEGAVLGLRAGENPDSLLRPR